MNEQANPSQVVVAGSVEDAYAAEPIHSLDAPAGSVEDAYAAEPIHSLDAPPQHDPVETRAPDPRLAIVFRRTARDLEISMVVLVAWLFLTLGEFVLAGLPEGLGWFMLIALSAIGYFAAEMRVAAYLRVVAYLPGRSLKDRLSTLAMVGLGCFALLLLTMILGAFLPEPLVTVVLFGVIGLVALWKRAKQSQATESLRPQGSWIVAVRLILVGAVSVAAMVEALDRIH